MPIPHLPAELLDHIVDHLHDRKGALRNCCLVSKSWIPRTREHLFADIRFDSDVHGDPASWKKIFPDPSTSPAHYTKTLRIHYSGIITAAYVGADGWIGGFYNVAHLEVCSRGEHINEPEGPLVPLHGFSPVIKSLRLEYVALPPSQVFDLILSFPLLEDLIVNNDEHRSINYIDGADEVPTVVQSPSPAAFTGSLELKTAGIKPFARRLLSLPGGIHFRKFTLMWSREEDITLTLALVERCSHTLESLDITCGPYVESESVAIDLSKATKLRDMVFRSWTNTVGWITTTFRTTISNHQELRNISIYVSCHWTYFGVNAVKQFKGYGDWMDLDRLLVQFLESSSTRTKVAFGTTGGESRNLRGFVEGFLPELTRRGMIDLIG